MNTPQRLILTTAALAVVALAAFPPFAVEAVAARPKMNLGHAWLFNPPSIGGRLGGVDVAVLVTQWFGVCLVAGLLFWASASKGTNEATGAATTADPASAAPQPASASDSGSAAADTRTAAPWRRFVARVLDMSLLSIPLTIGVYWLAAQNPGGRLWDVVRHDSGWAAVAVMVAPVSLVVEWLTFVMFRATPGKALLGLTIEDGRGNPAEAGAALLRLAKLWVVGLAFSVPLVSWFSMAWQRHRLLETGRTTYDSSEAQVVAHRISHFRAVAAVLAVVLLLFTSTILGIASVKAFDQRAPVDSPRKSGDLTKPGSPLTWSDFLASNGYDDASFYPYPLFARYCREAGAFYAAREGLLFYDVDTSETGRRRLASALAPTQLPAPLRAQCVNLLQGSELPAGR